MHTAAWQFIQCVYKDHLKLEQFCRSQSENPISGLERCGPMT